MAEGFRRSTDGNKLKLEEYIVDRICQCGGSISLTPLYEELVDRKKIGRNCTVETVRVFLTQVAPHNVRLFKLEDDARRNECTVSLIATVGICRDYNPRQERCSKGYDCEELHCCYHFVTSRCLKGRKCLHDHTLDSPHNQDIIEKNGLGPLDESEIFQLLRNKFLQISICTFYNSTKGCSKNNECKHMHVCRHYAIGDCKFTTGGTECRYSHVVKSQQAMSVWSLHGIDANDKTTPELLQILRQATSEECREVDKQKEDGEEKEMSVPNVCFHYNKQSCKKGDGCSYLHVCSYFISGTCKYSQKCHQSHDIKGAQPMAVWRNYPQIDTRRESADALLELVRTEHGRDSSFKEKGSDAGGYHDRRLSQGGAAASEKKNDKNEICEYNLRGTCNFGDKCRKLHTSENYQWQMRDKKPDDEEDTEWTSYSDASSVAIETKFCDLTVMAIKMKGKNEFTLNFGEMHLINTSGRPFADVRRIETPIVKSCAESSADASTTTADSWQKVLNTNWGWYWRDDGGVWNRYSTSKLVEAAFQNFTAGSDSTFKLETSQYHYEIDFIKMHQKNLSIGTVREILRRPHSVTTHAQLLRDLKKMETLRVMTPANWDPNQIPMGQDNNFAYCKLSSTDEEFKFVADLFGEKMDKKAIVRIKRVQNIELWDEFERKRQRMLDSQTVCTSGNWCPERHLFHGTSQSVIKAICQQNFDARVSGSRVGTLYGQGCYFSKSAKYSDSYAMKDATSYKRLFLVRVLVGSFVAGKPEYRRPPLRDPSKRCGPLYDSCVDRVVDPLIFVTFDSRQVYPEYIITYKAE